MSNEPGPEGGRLGEEAMIARPVEPMPRGWPSAGAKLLAVVAALVGLVLLITALLGGFLLPVAKDCAPAFGVQVVVSRACHEAAVPLAFVWLAFFVVGGIGVIFALVRTYFSLRPQARASQAAEQPSFVVVPQPEPVLPGPGEPIEGSVPGPESPWTGGEESLQRVARRPRRWPYITAIIVLALGVLGLGAGYAYSTNSAEQWRATADRTSRDLASMTAERDGLLDKNSTLTSQLSDTTDKLIDTTSKLNLTTSNLNDANGRIRSLANEKAQLGDNAAILAELVAASQNVSTEMSTCISDLQKMQTYLVDYRSYDQAQLISYVRGVNSECNTARADSDSLTQKIQGLGK
ncbi:hypothetical protein ACX801_08010 [Arthrobacter bambusae]